MGCCESKANVETKHEYEIRGRRTVNANASDGLNQPS